MSANIANGRWADFPLSDARREGFIRPLPLAAIGIIFLSLLLTASGAYDTDEMTLLHRWAFWLVFSFLVIVQSCVAQDLLRHAFHRAPDRLSVGGATVGITVVLLAAELHGLKFTPLLPKEPDPFFEFVLFVAPPVAAISIFTLLIRNGLRAGTESSVGAGEVAAEPPPVGIAPPDRDDFAPTWPDAPVLWVRARDHYLEIATAHGTRFIRGRMKDAVAHLEKERGVRAHRSWWVAAGEISGSRVDGRDYVLLLRNGREIPVGR